jgi:hypothetical protein
LQKEGSSVRAARTSRTSRRVGADEPGRDEESEGLG